MENKTTDPKDPTQPVTNPEDNKKEGEEKDEEDFVNPFLEDDDLNEEDEKEEEEKDEDEEEEEGKPDKSKNKKQVSNPLMDKIFKMERKAELDQFLSSDDGKVFKKFEAKIKEYALDKRAKGFSISAIAYAVAGKNLMKIGAEIKKKADDEAGKTATAGDDNKKNRTEPDLKMPDISKMNKQDFNEMVEKAKRGEIKLG